MNNKINIPSFPSEWDYIDSNRAAANGMTLRDYFAAKAMQSLVALDRTYKVETAEIAYGIADAMLAERNKE